MGPFDQQIQSAVAKRAAGDLVGAEAEFRAILQQTPGMPMVSALLGGVLTEAGRPDETIEMLAPIAEAQPDRPLVRFMLGMALNKLGRTEDALRHLDAACSLRPYDPQSLFWRGASLERLDRRDEAEASFLKAIEAAAGHGQTLGQLGTRMTALLRFDLAARCFEGAIDAGSNDAGTQLKLATSYQSLFRYDDAMRAAKSALAADPKNPSAYMAIADIHEKMHNLERGAASAREGLRIHPTHTVLARILAKLERRMGRPGRADKVIRQALRGETTDPRMLAPLLIEHGRALDAMGDYDAAFASFSEGNKHWLEIGRELFGLDAYPDHLRDRAKAVRILQERAPQVENDLESPVFFVGFPRSGTTLMEQVLAAHSEIVTLGEADPLGNDVTGAAQALLGSRNDSAAVSRLSDEQALKMRSVYWASAQRMLAEPLDGRLLVDKHPLNITRVALIRRLFPRARLLIALRDPRDCCLSAFMQSFEPNEAMIHFHSIESTVAFYSQVMDLWLESRRSIGDPFLEYRYEDLTLDFEGTTRRVLGFLGLEWTDDILQFQRGARERMISTPSYERVVAPIDRKSVARWRNYEKHFGEALDILRPYVEAFGYED